MPLYDYECQNCKTVTEFMHSMRETSVPCCPACSSRKMAKLISRITFKVPDSGWEYENNGRGRFITQIAKREGNGYDENDPNAFCRSQREAIDKAKAQGYSVSKV